MSNVFVFGSNLAGRHGAGAALAAKQQHGAIYGRGWGIQGNSYAIPTKDGRGRRDLTDPKETLPLDKIEWYVDKFILFALSNPDKTFDVTRIGCGLAGFTDEQIAPMFKDAPSNCNLPDGWREICTDVTNVVASATTCLTTADAVSVPESCPKKCRVIIAGGREFNDYEILKDAMVSTGLWARRKDTPLEIVSGKARGADTLGEIFAKKNHIPVAEFPANWDKHGKSAGYKRNTQMAQNADVLLAFWDGESVGTKHMIDIAKAKCLEVFVIRY